MVRSTQKQPIVPDETAFSATRSIKKKLTLLNAEEQMHTFLNSLL